MKLYSVFNSTEKRNNMNPIKLFLLFGFAGFSASALAQSDTIKFSQAEKLSSTVNSSAEESFPLFSADGKTLYFARTFHADNTGGKYSGQDVWMSKMENDNFTNAENFTALNSKESNVIVGVSINGDRLYVLNHFDEEGNASPGVSIIDFDQDTKKWSKPRSLIIPDLDISGMYYSAYVSPDENFILWSMPGSADADQNDLYVSLSGNQGVTWTPPISLGKTINTGNDEISPFFDFDESVLYFSANRPGNPDDYDIYYSVLLDDSWTNWSKPVNAGSNINSSDFDAYFYMTPSGTAYFSSNRNDTLTNLYVSDRIIPEPKLDDTDDMDDEDVTTKTVRRDPVLIIETADGGKQLDRSIESLTKEELLDKGTRIRFVYFEYNKYDISARYINVFDEAGRVLDKYPNMNLRIEGHTDAIGSDAYNQVLSDNRAASAKEFLVINGVIPDRLTSVGIGEKEPYASNLTDEGRSLNRRVELFFSEK